MPQEINPNKSQKPRELFIDNLRVLMTVLVIFTHLSISYGGPGDWYYNETGKISEISQILMTLMLAINQSFFMGFFFMLSSYFMPGSYDRKGPVLFLKDRFKRLGIPLLFYMVVITPLLEYRLATLGGYQGSFSDLVLESFKTFDSLGVGVMWFVETLLFFSVVYVIFRLLNKNTHKNVSADQREPGFRAIFMLALGLGLTTFVLRIWMPVGTFNRFFNIQPPFFPQYIALYILGIFAYRRGWFQLLSERTAKIWRSSAYFLLVLFPILFVTGGALEGSIDQFLGGTTWQSFAYAVWEQFMCFSMIISLTYWFREKLNYQGKLLRAMSAGAYGTYLLHAPVIIFLALALREIKLDLGLKFLLVVPFAVGLSFLAGYLAKKLPVARDIL